MHQNETAISRHGGDSQPEHFGMKQRLEVAVKATKIARPYPRRKILR